MKTDKFDPTSLFISDTVLLRAIVTSSVYNINESVSLSPSSMESETFPVPAFILSFGDAATRLGSTWMETVVNRCGNFGRGKLQKHLRMMLPKSGDLTLLRSADREVTAAFGNVLAES